jgi:uncharacterized radical SAM superfamily protein
MTDHSLVNNKHVFKNNSVDKTIIYFHPGKKFPAISLTGSTCKLSCAHCGGKYLNHMKYVKSPTELKEFCFKLDKQRANGVLLSGGCDHRGHVMFDKYLEAISEIKSKTKLMINLHTGIITEKEALDIVKSGIDVVSIDIIGNRETINQVYGLQHSPEDYLSTIKALKSAGIKMVVPHVCVGLHFGKILGEYNALDMISEIEPKKIVFIVLIPTRGTGMANIKPPKISEVVKLIEYANRKCPITSLYLGCMRPKSKKFREYNQKLELALLDVGIDGIVLPSKNTVKSVNGKGIETRLYNRCCAI